MNTTMPTALPPDPNKLKSLRNKISPSVTESFAKIQADFKKERAARALERKKTAAKKQKQSAALFRLQGEHPEKSLQELMNMAKIEVNGTASGVNRSSRTRKHHRPKKATHHRPKKAIHHRPKKATHHRKKRTHSKSGHKSNKNKTKKGRK